MGAGLTLWKGFRRFLLPAVALMGLSACVSMYRDHGYVPPAEDLAKVRVGVDTRETVTQTIGTPGMTGVLRDSGYYYVTTRFRHYGAREPEPVSRRLLAISFDNRGVVRNIEEYGLSDGRVVVLQRRVTDNGESDQTFLRQMLGNLGNFNPGTLAN